MTTRDRLILIAIAAIAILGAGWELGVKPAQEQASKVSGEVSAARSQLETAQGEVATARTAEQHYRAAYASLATLGIAVPTSSEVPALIYTIDQASNRKKIDFSSIDNGSGGSGGRGSSTAAQAASFTPMPLTFTFAGSYKDLIDFLKQLEGFTVQSPTGTLQVSGRLLTIQSISFSAPAASTASSSPSGGSSGARPGEMTWSIAATAYVLPAAATTPAPPAGTSSGPQPASSGAGSSGSAAGTPAVVRATP